MSRNERRAMILDAIIPLLIEHGRAVTSKQIAAAAGVAEGTIFSVFDDKDAIIAAAVDRHIDASSIVNRIAAIPSELPLEERIHAVVVLMQAQVQAVFGLMASIGFMQASGTERRAPDLEEGSLPKHRSVDGTSGGPGDGSANGLGHHSHHGHRARFSEPPVTAIAELLAADTERLSVSPRQAAQIIRLATISMTHPLFTEGDSFTPDEITAFLINGCTRHPLTTTPSSVAADPATTVTV